RGTAVGRSIVDEQQFPGAERLLHDAVDGVLQVAFRVVEWHDDRGHWTRGLRCGHGTRLDGVANARRRLTTDRWHARERVFDIVPALLDAPAQGPQTIEQPAQPRPALCC